MLIFRYTYIEGGRGTCDKADIELENKKVGSHAIENHTARPGACTHNYANESNSIKLLLLILLFFF